MSVICETMHNLSLRSTTPFATRCATFLAAWWLAALLSGLWGWGMGNLTPQNALHALCASAKASLGSPPCACAMCASGAKCCCKNMDHTGKTSERAALSARCDDGDTTPNAAPLAEGTWHAPVYFAASPVPAIFRTACRDEAAFFRTPSLCGRTPAPSSPPPLSSFTA